MLRFSIQGFRYIFEKSQSNETSPQITVPYSIENFDWDKMTIIPAEDKTKKDESMHSVIILNVLAALSDFHVIFFRDEDDISVRKLDGIRIKKMEGKTVEDFEDLFDKCRSFQYFIEGLPAADPGGDNPSAWILISFRPLFLDKKKKQAFFPIEVRMDFYNTLYEDWSPSSKEEFWDKLDTSIKQKEIK